MAEAAGTAGRVPKLLNFDKLRTSDGCDNELGDALIGLYCNRMLPQVDQNHLYLAAIISVDGSWRIQHGQPVLEGAAASRPYLPLEPWWYFDRDTSRNGCAGQRSQHQGLVHRGYQINASSMIALIAGHRSMEPLNFDDWNDQAIESAPLPGSISQGCEQELTCWLRLLNGSAPQPHPRAVRVKPTRAVRRPRGPASGL